jgi:transcriptional regulator with XRE-family HTH domain
MNHNADTDSPDPKAAMRENFAQRLSAARMRKNWNQSDLAREAAKHVEGQVFGRALVSSYERARMFPNPFHLKALAAALGVMPDDLAPSSMPKFDDPAPQLETRDLGNGKVLLRVNQQTDWKIALKILELLRSESAIPQT